MLLLLTVFSACCPQASPALSPNPVVRFLSIFCSSCFLFQEALAGQSLWASPSALFWSIIPILLVLVTHLPLPTLASSLNPSLSPVFFFLQERSELEGNFLHHSLYHYSSFYLFLPFPATLDYAGGQG